jgi:hemerythrin-like metal-binding protein
VFRVAHPPLNRILGVIRVLFFRDAKNAAEMYTMAAAFHWNDQYCVDHGQIDEDHKGFLDLANQILALDDTTCGREHVKSLVMDLFRYMETHFEREEEFMRSIDYPYLDGHILDHQAIVWEMNELIQTTRSLDAYIANLRLFMVRWVLQHIESEDAKIADHLLTTA